MLRAPRRRRSLAPAPVDVGAVFIRFIKNRLANRDQLTPSAELIGSGGLPHRLSHAEFLADWRARPLANPATAALLDRLERVIR